MKTKLTIAAFALAAATLFAAPANAQIAASQRTTHVPFAFQVGEKELPAGDYLVAFTGNQLQIWSLNGAIAVAVPTIRKEGKRTPTVSFMEFNRTGEKHYLEDVWFAGQDTGLDILAGRKART